MATSDADITVTSASWLDRLTDSQKVQVDSLLAVLAAAPFRLANVPKSAAARFLMGSKFDVDKAALSYAKMLKWRAEKDIDSFLDKLPSATEVMGQCIPHVFLEHDKAGRPIYLERTGHTDAMRLMNLITTPDKFRAHIYAIEYQLNRAREESERRGVVVDQITTILDCKDVTLDHIDAMEWAKQAGELDGKMYPFITGNVFVINAPALIRSLWAVAKHVIDPLERTVYHVVGENYRDVLLKYIDASVLPVEYGGTAMLKVPDASCTLDLTANDPELLERDIGAGKSWGVIFNVREASGATVEWFFRTEASDIKFTVVWKPDIPEALSPKAGGAAAEKEREHSAFGEKVVVPESRGKSHKWPITGEYDTPGPGSLVFTWDNSFSFFKAKKVKYNIKMTARAVDDELAGVEEASRSRASPAAAAMASGSGEK